MRSMILQIHHVEVDRIDKNQSSEIINRSRNAPSGFCGSLRVIHNHNSVDIIRKGNALFVENRENPVPSYIEKEQIKRNEMISTRDNYLKKIFMSKETAFLARKLSDKHGIKIYGRTLCHKSVTVHIRQVYPYFYIHCPQLQELSPELRGMFEKRLKNTAESRDNLTTTFSEMLLNVLISYFTTKNKSISKRNTFERIEELFMRLKPFTIHSIIRKPFFGYNENDHVFLRISCRNEYVANLLIFIASRSNLIGGTFWDIYHLYHHPFRLNQKLQSADIAHFPGIFIPQNCWVAQFLHDSHCRGMDWIKITGFRRLKERLTSTDVEISVPLSAIRLQPVKNRGITSYSSQVGSFFGESIQCPSNLPNRSPTSEERKKNVIENDSPSPQSVQSSVFYPRRSKKTDWRLVSMTTANYVAPSMKEICTNVEKHAPKSSEEQCSDLKTWDNQMSSFYDTIDYEFTGRSPVLSRSCIARKLIAKRMSEQRKQTLQNGELPLYCFRILYLDVVEDPTSGFLAIYLRLTQVSSGMEKHLVLDEMMHIYLPSAKTVSQGFSFENPSRVCAARIFIAPNEAQLVYSISRFILQEDPDIIFSWDHDRNGINTLKVRYRALTGIDLHIGRCPGRQRSKGKKENPLHMVFSNGEKSDSNQNKQPANNDKAPFSDIISTPDNFLDAFSHSHRPPIDKKTEASDDDSLRFPGPDQSSENNFTFADSMSEVSAESGRLLINLWKIYRHDHGTTGLSFESRKNHDQTMHTLSAACWSICGWRMADIPPDVFHYQLRKTYFAVYGEDSLIIMQDEEFRHAVSFLATHMTHRHRVVMEIFEKKWKLLEYIAGLCLLYGILFIDVLSRGSQFRVESVISRDIDSRGFMYPSIPGNRPNDSRGFSDNSYRPMAIPLVLQPNRGFYRDPVIVLDFRSLYPSIMIAYNLCYTTLLSRDAAKSIDSFIAPNGERFVTANTLPGVFPQMLTRILANRVKVNTVKKYAIGKEHKQFREKLDRLQLGLKLLSNVCYGYTSAYYSGRLPCARLADAIVMTGRKILEETMCAVHENSPQWKEFGVSDVKVVYGDTDSLFVHVPGGTRKQAHEIGTSIVKLVAERYPRPISLKVEKIYQPCFLLESKRYTGNAYMMRPHQTKKHSEKTKHSWEAKGIECVRRDTNSIAKKLLRHAIERWFEWQDSDRIYDLIKNEFRRMLAGQISPSEYVLHPEIRAHKLIHRDDSKNFAEVVAPKVGYPYANETSFKGSSIDSASGSKLVRILDGQAGGPKTNVRFSEWQPSSKPGITAAMRRDRLPVVISALQASKFSINTLNRERVPYLIQYVPPPLKRGHKNANDEPLYVKVIHPVMLQRYHNPVELDILHYIKHKVAPPLLRIFKHVGVNIPQCVEEASADMNLPSSSVRRKETKNFKKFTKTGILKAFRRVKTHCVLCKNPLYHQVSGSPPSNSSSPSQRSTCDACKDEDLSKEIKELEQTLARSTRKLFYLHKHCESCIGLNIEEIPHDATFSCQNCECPKFYERVRERSIHSAAIEKVQKNKATRMLLSPKR